uniref:B-related factor 1 n=1 Tax=Ascaris suum TaxID=6253 RepID=F1KRU3_ASCSU
MGRKCPHCGSSEIDDDATRGDSTCVKCGMVLEESAIVLDVTYQERSGAGSTLVGQFISHDHEQRHTFSGVPGLPHQEPREVTYMKGKKLIVEIASQLRINQHCIDTAHNFFRMCVCRNFTRGRMRSHVVAACLYMTCRLENTAHLLLDFSDVTQVNVFDLGRTLNFLARSLKINLPTTDPCLYILRFAVLLEFGEKEKEVVSLATRLVQRMKRDWIATGRRPTGLCGAALVLAARCYNFNRTIGDIVRVVHISETVVRKRLDEFGKTPSSELTIDEFTTVDLEHCEDPPAFRESRRKAREQLKRKEEETAKKIELEVEPLEEEVEKALEKKRREKFKKTPYAKMMSESLVKESPELRLADPLVRDEIVEMAFDAGDERQRQVAGMSSCYAPTLESLGISDPLKPQPLPSKQVDDFEENSNGELDLEGIDDDEIDTYILSREEAEMKSRLWMKLNKEHLAEMERRERERAEEEEREKEGAAKKKRKKSSGAAKKKEPIVASTVQEAMVKVIQEKRLSNKINYEILKEIEDSESSALKPFYPTRTEIISCLGGGTPGGENTLKREQSPEYSCSSSPRLPISQSNTAVFSDNKELDHKTTEVKLLPRLPWSRFTNTTRFKSSDRLSRHSPNVVKQEKPSSEENGNQSSQMSPISVDFKDDDIRKKASLLPESQSELMSTKATAEVILVAERTDAGLRGEDADRSSQAVENCSGERQLKRNAPRVSRGRYAKLAPNLATASGKKNAAHHPVDESFNSLDMSTVGTSTSSSTGIGAIGNLGKDSSNIVSASKQQGRKSCVVVEEGKPEISETAEPLAVRSRYTKVPPKVCTAKRFASKSVVPTSEQADTNLTVVIEEDASRKPEVVVSSSGETLYATTRPNLKSAEHMALGDVVSTKKELSAQSDPSSQQLSSALETNGSMTVTGQRKRSAVANRNERVTKRSCRGQLQDVTGLAAMAALGRDSDSSYPKVRIIHSSARCTSELAASSNCTSVPSTELSSSQDPLTSGLSQSPDPDRSIHNASTETGSVTSTNDAAPKKLSADIPHLRTADVSGVDATLTPSSQKIQQVCIHSSADVAPDEASKALSDGSGKVNSGGTVKGTRSRYVKVRPNIGCATR